MKTSAKILVQNLVQELFSLGLEYVVFSPGSRSAPLVIGFNAIPEIKKYVILDERSAAFFALGLAIELKKPVALVCTSGSAATNYFPAITEAYYQGVPLIAISADRPIELVNQGDGQTIMQDQMFGKHVRFALSLTEKEDQQLILKEQIRTLFQKAQHPGPVHLNIHFSEPLYDQVDYVAKNIEKQTNFEPEHTPIDLKEIQDKWNTANSKMIVIGQLQPCVETEKLLLELAADTSVAILCENISNQSEWKFVTSIDRAFSQIQDHMEFVPEFLMVLGSSFVSKNLKLFLRNNAIKTTVIVDKILEKGNTFQCTNPYFLNISALQFLQNFNIDQDAMHPTNFGSKWKQLDYFGQSKQEQVLSTISYSDLKAVERLITNIPDNATFHIGNSSIVRYTQQFTSIRNLIYRSNRGVAGIDGSLSTSAGAAASKQDKLHVILLGDLSFFYDNNAFLNHYLSPNLRIVVLNNGGGSIFGMLPGPKTTQDFETYFKTKQKANIEKLCEAHSIYYKRAIRIEDLDPAFENLFSEESDAPILLEIVTSECENEKIFAEYKQQMTN